VEGRTCGCVGEESICSRVRHSCNHIPRLSHDAMAWMAFLDIEAAFHGFWRRARDECEVILVCVLQAWGTSGRGPGGV
jgi:hypothetical protein